MADEVNPLAYNSLWQLRADAWSRFEDASERLATAAAQERPVEQVSGQASYLLGLLDPIERYWAFPGGQRLDQVRRLFAAGDLDGLARLVASINRALVTDSYRRGSPGRRLARASLTSLGSWPSRSPPVTAPISRCWSWRS